MCWCCMNAVEVRSDGSTPGIRLPKVSNSS